MRGRKWLVLLVSIPLLFGCTQEEEKQTKDQNAEQNENENQGIQETETHTSGDTEQNDSKNNHTEIEQDGITLEEEYFNETEVVNGQEVIVNTNNMLVLVNKQTALPADYTPNDLVRPNVEFSFGDQDIEKSYLREAAARALENMFTQAEAEGIYLFAVSGYRSYDRQDEIFRAEVSAKGEEKAREAVAVPGQSEHQTGLAMDISASSVNYLLTEEFENTPEGKWLADNAHRFGFILRYPKGSEAITGYKFEPWHFRFVGKETAEIIYENNWTLEEFFEQARAI